MIEPLQQMLEVGIERLGLKSSAPTSLTAAILPRNTPQMERCI